MSTIFDRLNYLKVDPVCGMWVTIDVNPIERIAIKVMSQTIVNPEQELLAQVLVKLQELEPHRQEQVLDFIEFLLSRQHQADIQEQSIISKAPKSDAVAVREKLVADLAAKAQISALEAAGDLVGCLEAPSDLSMRKKLFKQKAIAQ